MSNLINDLKNVLVLSPHTDDMEFGCGGLVSRLIREGKKITHLVFSICEESVPEGFKKNILEDECKASSTVLGINEENLIIKKFKVRNFPAQRQEILDVIIKVRNQENFDLVLIPSSNDFHQDHKTIYEEGLRAFKNCNLIGYQLFWNNLSSFNEFYIRIDNIDLENKIKSIKEYKTQIFRPYSNDKVIYSQAELLGFQSGKYQFAESFEIIRLFS